MAELSKSQSIVSSRLAHFSQAIDRSDLKKLNGLVTESNIFQGQICEKADKDKHPT